MWDFQHIKNTFKIIIYKYQSTNTLLSHYLKILFTFNSFISYQLVYTPLFNLFSIFIQKLVVNFVTINVRHCLVYKTKIDERK